MNIQQPARKVDMGEGVARCELECRIGPEIDFEICPYIIAVVETATQHIETGGIRPDHRRLERDAAIGPVVPASRDRNLAGYLEGGGHILVVIECLDVELIARSQGYPGPDAVLA